MVRQIVGIVAASVCALVGGWVAVATFVFAVQPLDAAWTPLTASNVAAGVGVLGLGLLLAGLQIAGLLEADRHRRQTAPGPAAEPAPAATAARDVAPTAGSSPEVPAPPPEAAAGPRGWSSQLPHPREEPPAGERPDEPEPRAPHGTEVPATRPSPVSLQERIRTGGGGQST